MGSSVEIIAVSGFTLPDDLTVVHNLTVGNTLFLPTGLITTGSTAIPYIHRTGTDSFFAGAGAGNTAATGAGYNTGIGVGALANTSNNAACLNNTAVGAGALSTMTTQYGNTAIGYDAGRYVTAAQNTAVGSQAMQGVSATPLTQINNTALGYKTGMLLQGTATNNTLLGANAGRYVTTGNNNTLIGSAAGESIITGTDNTAVGANALTGLVSSTSGLTAIGSGALAANTSGVNNTAVGYQAGHSMITGYGNTTIGYDAGQYVTAAQNTAVGSQAMQGVSATPLIAINNAALGYKAGLALQGSATNNTLLGANAGRAVTTGSNNTFVGQYAGQPITTGSNNIIIGNAAGSSYTATNGSNICIGNAGSANETNTIRIGTQGSGAGQQNACYIAGIRDKTTGVANAIPILIDSNGQLGTISSSRRYKENIVSLSSQDRFMQLNPVTFNYKTDESRSTQYGLIAEEVDELYPELVNRNKDGEIEAIKYHELDGILIREIQENRRLIAALTARIAALEQR
ncbi:MAG: tail fiber domain-containing protein [Candidatus Dependentiae bacterium]|nr:tail fiber domain-containing protein [Candidatus Dependentiae bacterium]